MTPSNSVTSLRTVEFVPLVALLMSLVALSVDAMLPALPVIGRDLGTQHPNEAQYVITALFIGLGIGQLFFGPLSDAIGRRPAIVAGLVVFIVGCLASVFASSFEMMIVGRVLQGLGASSPRIVTMALVRDQYSGVQMARILSFIMAVFILVPAVAPLLGQTIMWLGGWRSIFTTFLIVAVTVLIWFLSRHPETLRPADRRPLSPKLIGEAVGDFLTVRSSVAYTFAIGLVCSPFVAFLNSAQQIFQDAYSTGSYFPLYFGILALAIGFGSLANDRLLLHYGMHQIVRSAAFAATAVSFVALVVLVAFDGLPPLWLYMAYMLPLFVSMGALFGNLNALAMQPLGHIAGVGAALVASIATFISVSFGTLIGQTFDGTVYFLVGSFALFGLLTVIAIHWANRPGSNSKPFTGAT
ncbi:MAG: multidrug effflux MFS transporter [Acidiferrobacterales bacterium]|nr:multidrug effflux MFS transporter [Acidiferrobacterales bacterium]